MKLLAVVFLAVCLIQGNNAQFGLLRNMFGGAQNAASGALRAAGNVAGNVANAAGSVAGNVANAARNVGGNVANAAGNVASAARNVTGNVASAAGNVAGNIANAAGNVAGNVANATSGAVSNAIAAANNIRSNLSGGAQTLLESATNNATLDSLTDAAKNLTPNELLEAVQGATQEVHVRATEAQNQLETAVNSVAAQAESALNATTRRWNNPVQAAVQRAVATGVNVKDCAVDGVLNLANKTVSSAVKCVTDKVHEAVFLAKSIAGLPGRASNISSEAAAANRRCDERGGLMRGICRTTTLPPIAGKSAKLVADTISYATRAFTLVTTIQTQLSACVTGVATKTAGKALSTGRAIVNCVNRRVPN